MRRAIQIPSAAHSALEYQRWAVRSQFRGEGRRFMRSMKRPINVPVLHLRGDADPYVLADPGVPDADTTHRTAATYPSPAQDISPTRKHRMRSTTSCRALSSQVYGVLIR